MSELLANAVLEYGDRRAAEDGLILRTTVGSGVHGIAVAGTDDHDEMAVFVEPERWALGVQVGVDRAPEHYVARSQPEGARSGPGDTDLVAHTLRKYLRLAVKGNPTALLPLFAPERDVLTITPLGSELRALAPKFLSQRAAHRFLGFMRSQRQKMVDGGRGPLTRFGSRSRVVLAAFDPVPRTLHSGDEIAGSRVGVAGMADHGCRQVYSISGRPEPP